jgi:hypothetical protein
MRGDRLDGPPGALLPRARRTCDVRAMVFHGRNSAPQKWRLNYEMPLQAENPGLK